MGRTHKHSKKTMINACEEYFSGKGSYDSIAKSLNVESTTIKRWCLKYEAHGSIAFEVKIKKNSYTKEFKMAIINEYLLENISFRDLGAKYNLSDGMINKWLNMYYNGIEIKTYNLKGDFHTMKSRNTTTSERLEIVEWVLENDVNYKEAADKFGVKYAIVYQWVKKYLDDGSNALECKKRGPKAKIQVNESELDDIDRLKLQLERETELRKRAEFKLEVLKKKEEFEQKLRSRK